MIIVTLFLLLLVSMVFVFTILYALENNNINQNIVWIELLIIAFIEIALVAECVWWVLNYLFI